MIEQKKQEEQKNIRQSSSSASQIKSQKQKNKKQIRDFMQMNIISANNDEKTIAKKVLEKIVPQHQLPLHLLKQHDQLVDYLKLNAKKYYDKFQSCYEACEKFKLSKYGQYCGLHDNTYMIFSQNILAFLELGKKSWQGFCYRIKQNIYIGQMADMKSHGEGKALYRCQHIDRKKKQLKLLYHQFIGQWFQGQIKKGIRKTYQDFTLNAKPFIKYNGQFLKFIFHGKGILRTREKTLKGKFQKGKHVANEPEKKAQRKRKDEAEDLQFINERKGIKRNGDKSKKKQQKLQGLNYINTRKQQIREDQTKKTVSHSIQQSKQLKSFSRQRNQNIQ